MPAAAFGGRILDRFPHPEPPRPAHGRRRAVLPVFLPFAGCPQRCVFCNQQAQTGVAPRPLEDIRAELAARLDALPPADQPSAGRRSPESAAPELAFYGGTFTALPDGWPRRFLELARPHLLAGRIARVRCSTRPDAVSAPLLAELKGLGLSLVELGVQSFDDATLAASGRGYHGAAARSGCEAVLAAGLALCVQLMPGMPGQGAQAFRRDVAQAAAYRPELARLYPCLVLEGTALAQSWRAGAFAPWPLALAEEELAGALLALWRAGVRVGRIGLAEEPGLGVLAGPRHPALGQMARARALLRFVADRLRALPESADTLLLPRRLRGEALGQGNALAKEYAALGLTLDWWDEADLALCRRGESLRPGAPRAVR